MTFPTAGQLSLLETPAIDGTRKLLRSPVDPEVLPSTLGELGYMRYTLARSPSQGSKKESSRLTQEQPSHSFASWMREPSSTGELYDSTLAADRFTIVLSNILLTFLDKKPKDPLSAPEKEKAPKRRTCDFPSVSWAPNKELVSFWNGDTESTVSAQYGSLLHVPEWAQPEGKKGNAKKLPITKPFRNQDSLRPEHIRRAMGDEKSSFYSPAHMQTEFAHTVPYSFYLLSHLERVFRAVHDTRGSGPVLDADTTEKNFFAPSITNELLFHLIPSPERSTVHKISTDIPTPSIFPRVAARFAASSPHDRPRFTGLEALIGRGMMDFTMAHAAADLRVQRDTLMRTSNALNDEEAASFIKSIETSIEAGGALRAPPTIALPVPLLRSSWKHPDGHNAFPLVWAPYPHRMPYTWTTAEHRQTVRMPLPFLHGATIEVTAVEGGRAAGRRMEMRVVWPSVTKTMRGGTAVAMDVVSAERMRVAFGVTYLVDKVARGSTMSVDETRGFLEALGKGLAQEKSEPMSTEGEASSLAL